MTSNLHHLPTSHAMRALTLARAIQPGWFDRIQRDELRKVPAQPTPDEHLDRLADAGRVVRLGHTSAPAGGVHALLDRIEQLERDRDQARRVAIGLEQQIGEIDRLAEKWSGWRGTPGGIGRVLLDITRGDGGEAA